MEKQIFMKWKTIEEYPNYMVSDMGEVKSLKFGKERILKGIKDKDGYLIVNLFKEGKKKSHFIHRLVALAFLPNPNNLSEVNHISEIKTDNRVENLEWCNREHNLNHGSRNERARKTLTNRKDLSKPILQFSKTGKLIRKWTSVREVERELGFNEGNISSCCNGKYNSSYGFIWRYE